MSIIKKRLLSYADKQLNESEVTTNEESVLSARVIDTLAGKIESLQMTNFMCHSNLELKFNSRINFITGKNGSGKSSIMAALIIVLGGSASLTGRGSGITEFIKKGETWAKVSITLVNDGINAFKRDVYGNRITISRSLTKTAGNSYVCRSESGLVVSRRKEEVENIVLAFNLQIRNPICILNQDVARTFLCASDSSLRFTMFAKATQLEHLKSIYMKTLELLIAAKKQLKTKEKGIENASHEISQLKEKLVVFASLEKHVHERTRLENEYFWSLVVDEEIKLNGLKSEKEYLINKKTALLEGEANFKRILKELEDEVKECEEKYENAKKARLDKSKEKSEIQRASHVADREIEKNHTALKNIMSLAERQLIDMNGVKEHLSNSDTIISRNHAEREMNSQKIRKLKGELSALREKLERLQGRFNEAQESKFRETKNLEKLKSDLGESEQNIRRLEILLSGAKAKSQNNLLKFGPFTPELVASIEEAAKKNYFIKKPVGPCGMHVRLSGDPKWARAVESVVGALMNTYCCDNQKDFQTLTHIMDRVCGNNKQPPIIISKFIKGRHNVESRKVVVRGLPAVVDVLSFDNDVVFNTFIDQARIETILLFETDTQAASLLTRVQTVPRNLKMGLTLQSDQYYPAPNYRTYCGDSKRSLKFFEGSSKGVDSIKKWEKELKEENATIQEKRMEVGRVMQDYMHACESLKKYEKKMRDLKHNERRMELELNHLKDLEESTPVVITKLALEEELRTLRKTYEESTQKASECKELLDSLIVSKNALVNRLNSFGTEEEEADNEITRTKEELDEKKYKLRQLSGKNQGANDQVAKVERKLKEINDSIRKSESSLRSKIKSAKSVCPERVETERSPIEVQKCLEKCEMYLKTAEEVTGSRQGTIAEYKAKVELYNKMRKTEIVLANAMETLTRVALKKEQRLSLLQSHTASLVSFYFQATLQTRGYDGQLKVDFENKVLDLEVKPKDASIARKDSKTLSGGERSYSTVSFILAIWKVVQMPIYFLDEFDVFMDKVNRKVIMDLLLEHAKLQTNKQFVFITPQDISSIKTSDTISIFRLPDPERKRI